MMVAVAVAGGALAPLARRDPYLRHAAFHRSRAALFRGLRHDNLESDAPSRLPLRGPGSSGWDAADDQDRLAAKYEHAARYPWLSVATDPPEPE